MENLVRIIMGEFLETVAKTKYKTDARQGF